MAIKVREVNIEKGHPPVDEAMRRMVNGLMTAKREGIKSVVLIHGYGSSGEGGAIKAAVRRKLRNPVLRGTVRDYAAGEDWMNKKKDFLNMCPDLKEWKRYVDGNKGLTIVMLK